MNVEQMKQALASRKTVTKIDTTEWDAAAFGARMARPSPTPPTRPWTLATRPLTTWTVCGPASSTPALSRRARSSNRV